MKRGVEDFALVRPPVLIVNRPRVLHQGSNRVQLKAEVKSHGEDRAADGHHDFQRNGGFFVQLGHGSVNGDCLAGVVLKAILHVAGRWSYDIYPRIKNYSD